MNAFVHPHKGYLNTNFHIHINGNRSTFYSVCSADDINVAIQRGFISPNEPRIIKVPFPGNYIVKFSNGPSMPIIVEDGYKFGGGKFKHAFISDECPWIIIVMHDRTYFYNRESEESYIEPISPDKITEISKDYVLFENEGQSEQTIYSLQGQRPLLCISDILFFSKDVVLWEEKDNNKRILNLRSFISNQIIRQEFDHLTIDIGNNCVIYSHNNLIEAKELKYGFHRRAVSCNFVGRVIGLMSPQTAICYESSGDEKFLYLYNIYSNKLISRISVEGQIAQINDTLFVDVWKRYKELKDDAPQSDELKEDYVYINLYPCDWDIFYTIKHTKLYKKNYCSKREGDWYLRSACHDFSIKIDTPFNKNVTVGNTICLYNKYESFVCNKKYQSDGYKIGQVFVKKGHVCLYDGSSLYSLNHSGYWEYDRKCKINLEYYDEFGVIEDINTKTYELENGKNIGCFNRIMRINEPFFRTNNVYVFSRGRALKNSDTDIPEYLSHSLKYGITVNEKGVFLYSLHKDKYVERQILINIFDKSKFSNVLLSEDGDSLLYQDGKCSVMLNLIDQSTEIFDNLSYVKHVNGIRPLFSKPSSLQPKVINPITKQMINCEMLEQYKFVSPDGRLYADTQLYDYIECFRRTDNRLISKEEYLSLKRKYDIPFNANAAEKERLKELREKFLLENIDFLIEEEPQIFKENEDEESISITEYVLGKPVDEFLSYLIGMRGIAIIRNMEDDNIVAKIDLGEPLWFLNYVGIFS